MSEPKKCPQCDGMGTVKVASPDRGNVSVVCGKCKGTGFVVIKEDEESDEILLLD